MANYNIFIEQEGGPKTNPVVVVEYPENTTSGTGHTSGSPLDLEVGDTLTFDLADTSVGPGGVTISGFSVFTDNSDIVISGTSGALTKTVASGATTANTLTFTKASNNTTATDNFYVERQNNFESSFLSTTTTSRKVAAKITNVTQSTSQTLALSNAGNSYTLSSLSTSVGDTVVITFYYTDGESTGKNIVRLKQTGGTGATATIGGIYTGGTISSIQNAGATGDPTLTGLPNPSTDNTFTISTSTQSLSSAVHEAVIVNGADPGDRYQVGFLFTIPTGITKIELQNEDDDDEESYTTTLTFPITIPGAITAPVISSVTNNNASAANVTATVNLSSNGSGGTLKYAQTTSNSVPASGWQTGNTFSHPRGTTRYYWASQDEDTSGAFDDSGAIAVGYLAPDTNVTISNNTLTIGPSDTSDSVVVSGTTSGETYVVTIDNGTPSTASYRLGETVATGSSTTINFSGHFPSQGNTYTYDIHAQRPTSTGGDGSSYTKASGVEFTVTRQSAALTFNYGILLLDTDGTSSIISPDTRFFVKLTDEQSFSLAAGASGNILLDMTGLTTSNSTVIVLQLLYPTTFVSAPTVTRITSGASEGFQLTNPNSSTISFSAFAARF